MSEQNVGATAFCLMKREVAYPTLPNVTYGTPFGQLLALFVLETAQQLTDCYPILRHHPSQVIFERIPCPYMP